MTKVTLTFNLELNDIFQQNDINAEDPLMKNVRNSNKQVISIMPKKKTFIFSWHFMLDVLIFRQVPESLLLYFMILLVFDIWPFVDQMSFHLKSILIWCPRFSSKSWNYDLRQPSREWVRHSDLHSSGALPSIPSSTRLEPPRILEPNTERWRQDPQDSNPDDPPSHRGRRWIERHLCCQLSCEKCFQKCNASKDS